jgi:MOSC domain-containing protein YiiM
MLVYGVVQVSNSPVFIMLSFTRMPTMYSTPVLVAIMLAASAVAGFLHPPSCSTMRANRKSLVMHSWLRKSIDQVGSWVDDLLVAATPFVTAGEEEENRSPLDAMLEDKERSKNVGRVIRTASRAYNSDTSKPSSREYTTRKDARSSIALSAQGIEGDYNHYRTVALQSTLDRAVSMLTTDSMSYLRSMYPSGLDGDLGENLYIDGVAHTAFRVGRKVGIGDSVLLEITEPIEPCANLCKLPYINNDALSPKQRIQQCQKFISQLDVSDGLRGWYAKVLQPGTVHVGDVLRLV